jgi:CRISPR-associated protein Cas1
MRRLLNTLFVTKEGAYLAKEGETVKILLNGKTALRVPIHNLEGIICLGQVGASPALMGLCGKQGVGLSFLTERGRFLARVQGPVNGNVLLRREQYRLADDAETSAVFAAAFVQGKILNKREVLSRALRNNAQHPDAEEIKDCIGQLANIIYSLSQHPELEKVRALEGEAARRYFSVFDRLIKTDKQNFHFEKRFRRPPLDRVNALLSFIYVLLAHDVTSALESVGLDPAVGFLHADRPGRSSLALDMMEELRSVLADRLVLSLINRKQVSAKGFEISETGAVTMDEKTKKTVLTAYQKRKQDKITHPFLEEKMEVGLIPFSQALLLARCIRGDIKGYPPYLWH